MAVTLARYTPLAPSSANPPRIAQSRGRRRGPTAGVYTRPRRSFMGRAPVVIVDSKAPVGEGSGRACAARPPRVGLPVSVFVGWVGAAQPTNSWWVALRRPTLRMGDKSA